MDDKEFKKTLRLIGAVMIVGFTLSLTMIYAVTKVVKFAWGDCS